MRQTDMDGEDGITVSVLQTQPAFGEVESNVKGIVDAISEAANNGAKLIVAPELATTGYMFASRQEAFSLAESVDNSPSLRSMSDVCQDNQCYAVVGFAEQYDGCLYNSAALLGPSGLVGTYRKLHLWENEAKFFEPGDMGLPVFNLPFGRIGILICYDGWFPETYRLLALRGADVVCVPTNWVPIPGQPLDQLIPPAVTLCMASAHVNSMYVLAADRVGVERHQKFLGRSVIVAPTGQLIGDTASGDQPEVLTATVDLISGRAARRWNNFNDPLRDRRTDIYNLELCDGVSEAGSRKGK